MNVPIFSAVLVVAGAALIVNPSGYTSGSFAVAFHWVPRVVWGVLFVVAGVLAFTFTAAWAVGVMIAVLAVWAGSIFASTFTGDAESVLPGVWLFGITLAIIWSVARRGADGNSPRR